MGLPSDIVTGIFERAASFATEVINGSTIDEVINPGTTFDAIFFDITSDTNAFVQKDADVKIPITNPRPYVQFVAGRIGIFRDLLNQPQFKGCHLIFGSCDVNHYSPRVKSVISNIKRNRTTYTREELVADGFTVPADIVSLDDIPVPLQFQRDGIFGNPKLILNNPTLRKTVRENLLDYYCKMFTADSSDHFMRHWAQMPVVSPTRSLPSSADNVDDALPETIAKMSRVLHSPILAISGHFRDSDEPSTRQYTLRREYTDGPIQVIPRNRGETDLEIVQHIHPGNGNTYFIRMDDGDMILILLLALDSWDRGFAGKTNDLPTIVIDRTVSYAIFKNTASKMRYLNITRLYTAIKSNPKLNVLSFVAGILLGGCDYVPNLLDIYNLKMAAQPDEVSRLEERTTTQKKVSFLSVADLLDMVFLKSEFLPNRSLANLASIQFEDTESKFFGAGVASRIMPIIEIDRFLVHDFIASRYLKVLKSQVGARDMKQTMFIPPPASAPIKSVRLPPGTPIDEVQRQVDEGKRRADEAQSYADLISFKTHRAHTLQLYTELYKLMTPESRHILKMPPPESILAQSMRLRFTLNYWLHAQFDSSTFKREHLLAHRSMETLSVDVNVGINTAGWELKPDGKVYLK